MVHGTGRRLMKISVRTVVVLDLVVLLSVGRERLFVGLAPRRPVVHVLGRRVGLLQTVVGRTADNVVLRWRRILLVTRRAVWRMVYGRRR